VTEAKADDGRPGWESILPELRVVKLTAPLQLLVPALLLPSLPKSTRGLSLHPGRTGLGIGFALLVASVLIGAILARPTGLWGGIVSFWILGTAGIVVMASALRPTAFVKPICMRCRLLPIIKEHEAIHLSGVTSEGAVWESMRSRHSVESLALEGDPAICSFCPIPKRLQRQ
jgi:hypothetical protein